MGGIGFQLADSMRNYMNKMLWWMWLLGFDMWVWVIVTAMIFANQLEQGGKPFILKELGISGLISILPWYVWIAIAHAVVCFVCILGHRLNNE